MESKFRQIVADSVYSVAVMGNVSTGEFELVTMQPLAKDAALPANTQTMTFLGVIGIVQGRPRTAFAELLKQDMSDAIVQAFCRRIEAGICEIERVCKLPAN